MEVHEKFLQNKKEMMGRHCSSKTSQIQLGPAVLKFSSMHFFLIEIFFINFKHIQIFAFCHINQYTNETADFRKRYNRKNPLKIKLKPKDTCF